jgi:PKD repeat protein
MRISRSLRWSPRIVVVALLAGLSMAATPLVASAAVAPVSPMPASAVSADALPTVQIDGVAWSQAVVGNRVFVGGRFTSARPAGAAPGTQLTPRSNLLAYDITTGQLDTSFAPNVNAQVLAVAASPDGRRVYVAGDFTAADGQARTRVAGYDTSSGSLVSSFNPPGPNGQVKALVATNDTVYVGGAFTAAGSTPRSMLAAYRASNGDLLPWSPAADLKVWALAVTPDGSTVFAGGSFQTINGAPAYGMAKLDTGSGGLLPWNATNPPNGVRNGGQRAGITSLRVDGDFVYGTSYSYGTGANHEGVFKAAVGSGDIAWLTNCHGDNYSNFGLAGVIYSVGHAHYCGNVGGGFPQYAQWKYQHSQAWADGVTGDILNEPFGDPNWHGRQVSPAMLAWTPEWAMGTFTGQYQAGWHITGNADYLVVGGEFPAVNGQAQQGLVRFARRAISPKAQGPRFLNNKLIPTLVPTSPTSVRVSWLAGFDRDDLTLTYQVYRNWKLIHTTSAASAWWNTPSLGFVDTGLPPGSTQNYSVVALDPDGHTVWGQSTPVTLPTIAPATNAYADLVRTLGARIHWPLSEAGGAPMKRRITDRVGVTDAVADNGVTLGQPGAITGGDTAAFLMDNDWSRAPADGTETAPDVVTVQTWVKTTTVKGGRIIGFGDVPYLDSGHRDRAIYLNDAGNALFGVRGQDGVARTVRTPSPVNDGQWHLLTASLSPAGLALFQDGALVATRPEPTAGEPYLGYWRLGGDSLVGWPEAPSSVNLVGTVDEIAIYPSALSSTQVAALWQASGRSASANKPPVPTAAATCTDLTCIVDAAGSMDPDGIIGSYSWDFGDGSTGTGTTNTHTYAAAGTYTITLTVTDNLGATATTTRTVTVTPPPNVMPTAVANATCQALVCAFNAAGSVDPDGSITAYQWAFGDGTTGSGATLTHTYAVGGTYLATLTVTDNRAATGSSSRSVTVSAPVTTTLALDSFGRTTSSGLGSADQGGPWSLVGTSSDYSVSGGAGRLLLRAGAGPSAWLNGVSGGNVDAQVTVAYDKPGTSGTYTSLAVRRVATSDYRVKIRVTATTTTLFLVKSVSGVETTLASMNFAPAPYQAGDQLVLRIQAQGSDTTTLRAKLWSAATAEPVAWALTASDTTPTLQGPGAVGIITYLSGSATNAPVTAMFDDLKVQRLP